MTDIDFPSWVKISACERESHAVIDATPHGVIREETSMVTDHGRAMVLWRARRTDAERQSPIGDRSLPLLAQAEPRPRPRVSARSTRYRRSS